MWKIGAPPFHLWLVNLMIDLEWFIFFVISSLQKVLPLYILRKIPLIFLDILEIKALKEYGSKIGLAFQIQDDIIDIESPSSVSGKDQGSDLDQDKVTYPSIVGLQESKIKAQELASEAKEILQLLVKNTDNLCQLADYIVSRKT